MNLAISNGAKGLCCAIVFRVLKKLGQFWEFGSVGSYREAVAKN
jgi:hypothetical protein